VFHWHRTLVCTMLCIHVYSWTVLRSQCVKNEESSLKPAKTRANAKADNCPDEWCSDADDWDIDEDDNNICTNSESLADGSLGSRPAATNIEHDDTLFSALSPSSDVIPVASSKPSDMSDDESSELLQHLTINNGVEKLVSTQDVSSADNVQQLATSDVQSELFESAANAAAQLESYYVYVMEEEEEETFNADQSDHVVDLLARYAQQEGSNFEPQLEFRACVYVSCE